MPSLKDFMEAMQASWPVALTISLAALALLYADHLNLEYMEALPRWLMGVVFLAGVCAAAVLLVAMFRGTMALILGTIRSIRSIGAPQRIARRLQELPQEEVHVLVWAKAHGRQVFTASFTDKKLVPLVKKGLVIRHGGQHSILEWPYSIPSAVWQAIGMAFSDLEEPNSIPSPFGYWS